MKKRAAKKAKKAVRAKKPATRANPAGVKTAKPTAPTPAAVAKKRQSANKVPLVSLVASNGQGPLTEADKMAAKQRDISVSEFFLKNRHLLGFDNAKKALLTTIKEAVDNSLDACEEAKILPEISVQVKPLEATDRFVVIVEDNGPGVVREQIPSIFGKLLYGSKFHSMKQARGQQGIGISAAGMYGQLTTGVSTKITSRISAKRPAHYFEIQIDTAKNVPTILKDEVVPWKKPH